VSHKERKKIAIHSNLLVGLWPFPVIMMLNIIDFGCSRPFRLQTSPPCRLGHTAAEEERSAKEREARAVWTRVSAPHVGRIPGGGSLLFSPEFALTHERGRFASMDVRSRRWPPQDSVPRSRTEGHAYFNRLGGASTLPDTS
jgi:hypothetical protein